MLDRPVESRPPAERRPTLRQAPVSSEPIEPEGLTVTALLAALRRRRWVLILCALLFPVVAYIAAKNLTPRYTASTSVLYETTTYAARELEQIVRQGDTTDAVIASQVEVIRSLSIARRVARQFNLDDRPEFAWWLRDAERVNTPWYRLRDALAQRLSAISADLGALVAPEPPAETPSKEVAEISAAEEARERLVVQVVKNSRVLQIRFTSEDPQLARDVANLVADLYIADQLESKFNTVRRANDYLGGQVRDLRQELQGIEQQIAELRATSGIQRGTSQGGLSAEALARLNEALIVARNKQADAEARLAAVQRGGGADICRPRRFQPFPDAGVPRCRPVGAATPFGESRRTPPGCQRCALPRERRAAGGGRRNRPRRPGAAKPKRPPPAPASAAWRGSSGARRRGSTRARPPRSRSMRWSASRRGAAHPC